PPAKRRRRQSSQGDVNGVEAEEEGDDGGYGSSEDDGDQGDVPEWVDDDDADLDVDLDVHFEEEEEVDELAALGDVDGAAAATAAAGLARVDSRAAWSQPSVAAAADEAQDMAAIAEAAAAVSEAAAVMSVDGGGRRRRSSVSGGGAATVAVEGLPEAQLSYLRALSRQDVSGADLGELLVGFFNRYGVRLDLATEAVSVVRGGITRKLPAWRKSYHGRGRLADGRRPGSLLAVEDPQQRWADIAGGSFNISGVLERFAQAARALGGAGAGTQGFGGPQRGSLQSGEACERAMWAAVQSDGSHRSFDQGAVQQDAGVGIRAGASTVRHRYTLLRAVLDPDLALCRSAAMARNRAGHAARLTAQAQTQLGCAAPIDGGRGGGGGGGGGDWGEREDSQGGNKRRRSSNGGERLNVRQQRIAAAKERRRLSENERQLHRRERQQQQGQALQGHPEQQEPLLHGAPASVDGDVMKFKKQRRGQS
ncbi:hypothetical protein Agub_g13972, partial [Astrephomene gubernaculifera]